MDHALSVAKALNNLHMKDNQKRMDKMRMHKLLYYIQKESLLKINAPLFEEAFEGWKYGPVLPCVQDEYEKEEPYADVDDHISAYAENLVKTIYQRYKKMNSWDINSQSQEEFSWQFARKDLAASENGHEIIDLDTIRLDVLMDKINRQLQ